MPKSVFQIEIFSDSDGKNNEANETSHISVNRPTSDHKQYVYLIPSVLYLKFHRDHYK